jgi:asparagine synthetase A
MRWSVFQPCMASRSEGRALTSMGILVDSASLRRQLEITAQFDRLALPYHRRITDGTLPLSIGGGIGRAGRRCSC